MPQYVYIVYTIDWNDETTIEGVFSTEEKAESFKASQPKGPFIRYIDEYEVQ